MNRKKSNNEDPVFNQLDAGPLFKNVPGMKIGPDTEHSRPTFKQVESKPEQTDFDFSEEPVLYLPPDDQSEPHKDPNNYSIH